jgi:rRNA maturation RNase YbeY
VTHQASSTLLHTPPLAASFFEGTLHLGRFEVETSVSEALFPSAQREERIASFLKRLETWEQPFLKALSSTELGQKLRSLFLESAQVCVELELCTNRHIQELNHQFRQKNAATDVLSFPLQPEVSSALKRPICHLGSIVISVEWAEAAVKDTEENLSSEQMSLLIEKYLIERFTHGCLHLLGMHHDTMTEYEAVVSLQAQVLHELY